MRFLFFLLPLSLFASSSFITQMEYASMLYKNPRGIGCDRCHGEKGEGKLIARYKETKRVKEGEKIYTVKIDKEFKAPAIKSLGYNEFKNALITPQKGMPKYYLTEGEIKALYFYLKQVNLEEKKQ